MRSSRRWPPDRAALVGGEFERNAAAAAWGRRPSRGTRPRTGGLRPPPGAPADRVRTAAVRTDARLAADSRAAGLHRGLPLHVGRRPLPHRQPEPDPMGRPRRNHHRSARLACRWTPAGRTRSSNWPRNSATRWAWTSRARWCLPIGRAGPSRWYDDLRRIAAYGSVLGTFSTITDYFEQTGMAGQHAHYQPDEYRSPYLRQDVAAGRPRPDLPLGPLLPPPGGAGRLAGACA